MANNEQFHKNIFQYVTEAQPALEKYASQHDSFLNNLETKLARLVNEAKLTEDDAQAIYKKASTNPSSILDSLTIETIQSHGVVSKQASMRKKASEGMDAFEKLHFGLLN